MSGELPHAALVRAWERGREIPAEVRAIVEWLKERSPLGGELAPADARAIAEKAQAERWGPEAIEGAMLLWQISTTAGATDKPAA